MFYVEQPFFSESRAVYEKRWKKYGTARRVTDHNIMKHMRFARWVSKATHARTHAQNM
jgi:hypothetical protein